MTGPAVLVPLDGSKAALGALTVARRLAELQDIPLRIVHVTDQARPLPEIAAQLGLEPEHLRSATLEVRAGDPAEAILKAADDCRAALIVMCACTAQGGPPEAISRATLAVLGGAACPVVLVGASRPLGDWTLKRVLAPHDGSPSVSAALTPVADLARRAGAEFVVLHVAGGDEAAESGSMAPPRYIDQAQHTWPAWTGEFLERLAMICPLADVRVRLRVGQGEPTEAAIRAATEESADLIAMAWRGDWGEAHALTFKQVLRDATCPVLVTRVPAA